MANLRPQTHERRAARAGWTVAEQPADQLPRKRDAVSVAKEERDAQAFDRRPLDDDEPQAVDPNDAPAAQA